MKKEKFILSFMSTVTVMVLALCLSACSSDSDGDGDGGGVGDVQTLYGTWQYTEGYAVEDGEKHHAHSVSADEAGYLHFENHGSDVCIVFGDETGIYGNGGPFEFFEEDGQKTLKIGSYYYTVNVLTSSKLEIRYYYGTKSSYSPGDYESATYKKVSDNVLMEKFGFK